VKVGFLTIVAAAVLAIAAGASAATKAAAMQLTCKAAPGRTVVTGGITDKSHFRFQWWYANGTTWKASAWIYYANASTNHGKVWIPTHGHATRAMATEHLPNGTLVRVKAACTS
jgi:hypothetical protein